MKFLLNIFRFVSLGLLFYAIKNSWDIGIQYVVSMSACLVWAATGYVEGIKGW